MRNIDIKEYDKSSKGFSVKHPNFGNENANAGR